MVEKIRDSLVKGYNKLGIQMMVFLSFTLSTVIVVLFIGVFFYIRFSNQLETNSEKEKQILINQVNQSLDTYLRNMMKVSDSLYYSVIKNTDLSSEDIGARMQLIYEVNKDHILHIALFDAEGSLMYSAPPARLKDTVDVKETVWYQGALKKPENLHFFLPEVQNLFVNLDHQYQWVVHLGRFVEITTGKTVEKGVLLVDMKYSGIEQIFKSAQMEDDSYIYLVDSDGNLIYHPKQQLIYSGRIKENHELTSSYPDGVYQDTVEGTRRRVVVKSMGYTGWKLVGVTKEQSLTINDFQNRLFIFCIFLLFVCILSIMNNYLSSKITNPIKSLEKSVKLLECSMDENLVYVGGSHEVRHLSTALKRMAKQVRILMERIMKENEAKRMAELEALQAQINPHFLYNTLDIIVWMVENEKYEESVKVVTALARLFRISLSKGRAVITVREELEHVRNYLLIQQMRFKDKFNYEIDIEEGTKELSTVKLIVQPVVENAVYHGMEFMDGDGIIRIQACRIGGELQIRISDNGFGMEKEVIDTLLEQKSVTSSRGSGIGLRNIQERIRIYFGSEYGVSIESEPDEGTEVTIHLPIVPYEEGNGGGRV